MRIECNNMAPIVVPVKVSVPNNNNKKNMTNKF